MMMLSKMKPTKILRFAGPGILSFLVVILVLSACTGDKDEKSTNTLPADEKSSSTAWTDLSAETGSFNFQNTLLSVDYGTEWRISSKTDTSIVLTHKENPGDVLLSIEWTDVQDAATSDLSNIYKNQLDIMSDEVEELESIKVGGIDAERYISMTSGSDRESIVSMHVLFTSGKRAYLVLFSASPDDFVSYISQANQVIDTIRINSG